MATETASTERTSSVAPRGPRLAHVTALDGVRAVAVAAVLLYHGGVSWLHGGFLGVDVFFVLSGFLITSLLLAEVEGTGRLRFLRFYERRARRLLPALVVLVVLVVVYAGAVVPHGTFTALPRQLVGTMLYVGNWTLIASHTTYFTMGLPPSPLEHTWSLAIEEQFYLVWPAVLLVLSRLLRRRAALAAACVAGSVVAMVATALQYAGGANPNALYFSTQAHVTTLLLGAAAAVLVLRGPTAGAPSGFLVASPRRRTAVGWAAVAAWAGTIAGFVVVRGSGSFLYRGGFLAVGAVVAVAIVATLAAPAGAAARALAWRPVAYLGRISYGVYLYHFPLFLWLDGERLHLQGAALLAVRVAVTIAVASVSYAVVEQPVRERRWLLGRPGLVGAVAGYAAAGVLAFSVASAATSVPFADRVAKWNFVPSPPAGTTETVLIVGDSMARTLGAGLNNPLTAAEHVFFAVNGVADCSLVAGEFEVKDFTVRSPERCDAGGRRGWAARWRRSIDRDRPDVSMLLFRLDLADHLVAGRWQHVGDPQFDCVLRDRLLRAAVVLSSSGRPVVLLTTPFYDSGEQSDGAPWPEDAPSRVRTYNAMLQALAAAFPGVVHVAELGTWLSPAGGFTRTIGSTVVRWVDGIHLTYAGDAYVLPRMLAVVHEVANATPTRGALDALRAASTRASAAGCPARVPSGAS